MEIEIDVDVDPANNPDDLRTAMSLVTALASTSMPSRGINVGEILRSHLGGVHTSQEVVQCLVQLVLAQAFVSQTAILAGYLSGRERALTEGPDAPQFPDIEALMPLLAVAVEGMAQG